MDIIHVNILSVKKLSCFPRVSIAQHFICVIATRQRATNELHIKGIRWKLFIYAT